MIYNLKTLNYQRATELEKQVIGKMKQQTRPDINIPSSDLFNYRTTHSITAGRTKEYD